MEYLNCGCHFVDMSIHMAEMRCQFLVQSPLEQVFVLHPVSFLVEALKFQIQFATVRMVPLQLLVHGLDLILHSG